MAGFLHYVNGNLPAIYDTEPDLYVMDKLERASEGWNQCDQAKFIREAKRNWKEGDDKIADDLLDNEDLLEKDDEY